MVLIRVTHWLMNVSGEFFSDSPRESMLQDPQNVFCDRFIQRLECEEMFAFILRLLVSKENAHAATFHQSFKPTIQIKYSMTTQNFMYVTRLFYQQLYYAILYTSER